MITRNPVLCVHDIYIVETHLFYILSTNTGMASDLSLFLSFLAALSWFSVKWLKISVKSVLQYFIIII